MKQYLMFPRECYHYVSETKPKGRHGISEQTFYNWQKKFGDMELSELRKLRSLEDESCRLKNLLADKELGIDCLKALLEKHEDAR